MNSKQIREAFLRFFEEKGHTILPSSSLIPHGDPTLLLTNAGMVQIKPYFLGEATPPNVRLVSCQKCFRTSDIDSVGDASHLTFFEMLGNFSVGDYFKKGAIAWAWEFVIERLRLPMDRLWISVFLDDNESFDYWLDAGVSKERIVRCGEEDNFWGPAGETGPCGPCSEILYDLGEEFGCGRPDCGPTCDCGRFSELWNLVFTQYYQDERGKRTPLASKNIDTGMGLERTAAIMQGKNSVYETDLFNPIMECISRISGKIYGEDGSVDRALRIIAEHERAATFLIADGVIPSNEGQGYVLRRVLRRAALFGYLLGLKKPFLAQIAEVAIKQMGDIYTELITREEHIIKAIDMEESKFDQTLNAGMGLLDEIITQNKRKDIPVISGEQAFNLYDTYGFPVELTIEIASNNNLSIDWQGFEQEMEKQRERARASQKFGLEGKSVQRLYEQMDLSPTEFVGYERFSHQTRVAGLIVEGEPADAAFEGQNIEVVLAATPFYGEMGGQVGDTGEIKSLNGKITVYNTVRPLGDIVAHLGRVEEGMISVGDWVEANIDWERRLDIARNHTATHLLQAALRRVLGNEVQQAGSLVAPDRLRFDFTYLIALSKEELDEVQRIVNENIRRNLRVSSDIMPYSQALAEGALALFGEKYGDEVRVVKIEDAHSSEVISAELCGGTHVESTGEIGFFHITSERSIGSGMRRVEAVTGRGAEALVEEHSQLLENIASQLETNPSEVQGKLSGLISELNNGRKRARNLEAQLLRERAESLLPKVIEINGIKVLTAMVSASNMELLRQVGDFLRDKLGSAVIVLGTTLDGNPRFLAMVSPDLVSKGIHAGEIVKQVAQVTGGGGGGKAQMAQAGGKDKSKIDEALRLVPELIKGLMVSRKNVHTRKG